MLWHENKAAGLTGTRPPFSELWRRVTWPAGQLSHYRLAAGSAQICLSAAAPPLAQHMPCPPAQEFNVGIAQYLKDLALIWPCGTRGMSIMFFWKVIQGSLAHEDMTTLVCSHAAASSYVRSVRQWANFYLGSSKTGNNLVQGRGRISPERGDQSTLNLEVHTSKSCQLRCSVLRLRWAHDCSIMGDS